MPITKPVSFRHFRREVLKLYKAPARRRATRAKIDQVLREFKEICKSTKDLDPAKISDWMEAHPERAAATHRSLLSSLRAACRYGAYKRWLENPFDYRPLALWLPADELEQDEQFPRHRSAAEITRVLRRADKEARGGSWEALRLRAALYCWAYTGAGKTEVLGLRVADVDLVARTITFRSHARRRLKTGARAARLAIPERLLVVLEGWNPPRSPGWNRVALSAPASHGAVAPWSRRPQGPRPGQAARRGAGVSGLTILAIRHTVGTLSEGWGIGELELQPSLGIPTVRPSERTGIPTFASSMMPRRRSATTDGSSVTIGRRLPAKSPAHSFPGRGRACPRSGYTHTEESHMDWYYVRIFAQFVFSMSAIGAATGAIFFAMRWLLDWVAVDPTDGAIMDRLESGKRIRDCEEDLQELMILLGRPVTYAQVSEFSNDRYSDEWRWVNEELDFVRRYGRRRKTGLQLFPERKERAS